MNVFFKSAISDTGWLFLLKKFVWFSDKFYMKSSNEVRIEFLVKIKTPAMTSKMHLAPFSLASSQVTFWHGIKLNIKGSSKV